VEYATLAAKRATEVFAYGEAARQLERALAVQDLVNPDDRVRRLDVLLALGAALFPSGDTERVVTQVGPDAFALAEELGDRERAFRACRLVLDCLFSQSAGWGSTARPAYLMWAERARHYSDPDSIERIYTDLAFAHELHLGGQYAQAHALRLQALALARQHGDPEALFNCAILLAQGAPKRWDDRVRLAKECAGWPRQGVSGQTLGYALSFSGLVLLSQGERAQAEDHFRQVAELAQRTRVATVGLFAAGSATVLAIVDGHLDGALELVRRYIERADEAGVPIRGRNFGATLLLPPALYLGRADVWLSMFGESAAPTILAGQRLPAGMFSRAAQRAICLAQLGRLEEARAVVGPILNDLDGSIDDESLIVALINLLQAAIVVEHSAAAQALAAHLTCVSHLAGEAAFRTCIGRHLGDAALLAGNRAAARAYYIQALESAGKIGFRPELALTHLRLAELLVEAGDDQEQSEALEHLDVAIPELQDMHMRPGLERGLALREKLMPVAAPEPSRRSASDTLTAREREIATLVADGLSNRDIAEKLVISEGTVEVHVKHILGKLGFSSRAQVAGWFAHQGPG
jgi:DNA-binding CsgD family transcriptional regulator